MSTHYDLVVVGAGSGNMVVDERFDDQCVAIVERGPFGGTCVNRGCIPSKMYVNPADAASAAKRAPVLGVPTEVHGAEWSRIRDRVVDRIDSIAADGRRGREEADNIDVLTGTARFVGERRLVVDLDDGESVEITADQVVLATGSRPVVPPIDGLDGVPYETSDTIMRIETLPDRLGIIGGGYIGLELAHVFSSYGSDVVQVESGDHLLDGQDADVAAHLTDAARRGWDVRVGVHLERVSTAASGDGLVLHLDDGSEVEVDVLLLAVGRVTNSDTLDLEEAGVETDDDGRIVVDEHQLTTAEGVWALGDASSPEPLKHVANRDASVVRHNVSHDRAQWISSEHDLVPAAVFTHPQVAAVGMTEAEAREAHDDVVVARHDIADIAFGWAMAGELDDDPEANGFVKLLARRSTGMLVGAHVVGPMASVLLQPLVMAMAHDLPVRGLAASQYWIHPALTEVVENALIDLEAELDA